MNIRGNGPGSGPLAGVRVLDFAIAGTGPYACGVLAEQGADVVKVERLGLGDIARWVGTKVNGISALYQMCNRGKRSIALDVANPQGRELFLALAATCDVVVQNYRPGVVDRLGVGYDDVAARNPAVVYASISGFGPVGPYRDKSAYDTVIQAYAGMASGLGNPESTPRFVDQVVADKVTALTAVQAITSALFARERGAGGQHLQLAMLDAVVNFVWVDAAGNDVLPDAPANPFSHLGTPKPLHFTDGWGVVTATGDADFAGMCKAFGVDGYDDPRVATIAERSQHRDVAAVLYARVEAAASTLSTAEAMGRLEAERVPCGVLLTPGQLGDDPQVRAAGLLHEVEHPVVGRVRQPRHATAFSATPVDGPGLAPSLGQHTDELLAEVGLDAPSIAGLRDAGVIA